MRKFQWVKIPPNIVSKNKNCVWVSVWTFPPLQADFELEEELFKQKQVEKKKVTDKKKVKTEVRKIELFNLDASSYDKESDSNLVQRIDRSQVK